MNNLEITKYKILEWFSFNNLKAYPSKCHLFIYPYEPVQVNVRGSIVESRNCEILLSSLYIAKTSCIV